MTVTSTLPKADQKKIADFLKGRHIPAGIGNREEACSIAAINLALSGTLSDKIPECMSPVVGRWIIRVQDAMPDEVRNSAAWRRLLPRAAGTGREKESERLEVIRTWMWETVLPHLQPLADKRGFGEQWRAMTEGKTYELAMTAKKAAASAYAASASAASASASAAATYAAATYAAATYAADAYAADAYAADARKAAWAVFDPAALLAQLVAA